MRDIYFEKEWQELYAKRENLPLECVTFSCTYKVLPMSRTNEIVTVENCCGTIHR